MNWEGLGPRCGPGSPQFKILSFYEGHYKLFPTPSKLNPRNICHFQSKRVPTFILKSITCSN